MMKPIRFLTLAAALLLLCNCGARTQKAAEIQTRSFPTVQVPSVYTQEDERLAWAQSHYWDNFLSVNDIWPSADSTVVNGVPTDKFEEAFASFVYLTEMTDIKSGQKALDELFTRTEAYQKADTASTVFEKMAEVMEKYYYDPNSPYRNEDLYLAYIKRLAASDLTPASRRKSLGFAARLCSLNPIGSPAADFRFKDIDGRTHRLYDVKAEHTLLFFSNPGCEACKEIIEALNGSEKVSQLLAAGRLAVVNIYIDEDLDAWRSYQDYYPDSWYNGYDPDFVIRTDLLYSVRAIPSLYMLDSEKCVIMKDATQENIFAFLENLN